MIKQCSFLFSFLFLFVGISYPQDSNLINPALLEEQWDAKWITHPDANTAVDGVYLFKKVITLDEVPGEFVVNITADNRYKFYVNGQKIAMGPARGDLLKWRFKTIDIKDYLKQGENSISAIVWDFGPFTPVAQITSDIGLIIQGNSALSSEINTNKGWKVIKDNSYKFYRITNLHAYYVTGPGEEFDGRNHPWDWKGAGFENDAWVSAVEFDNGNSLKSMERNGRLPNHALYPRNIPDMETKVQSFKKVRRTSGINNADELITGTKELVIPANKKVSILLDQEELTNAYPQMIYSRGKNSKVKITYSESLYYPEISPGVGHHNKGNRNEIDGKEIKGNSDIIICDGGENRTFEPLWWRCFRYVQLDIETKDEPLVISKFSSEFTGYPLKEKAVFQAGDESMKDIWDVSWRTQRLCAGETFFDCPYYEQLQYVGDTRIQALITFFVSGDTLLWRKAITDFYDSRYPTGLTQSRYPSKDNQFIPTFSLIWITMLHDYITYCNDPAFIRKMIPAVMDILQWYEERLANNGMPGKLEHWTFVDWVRSDGWRSGVPPLLDGKSSGVIGLQYVYTINKAIELFDYFGLTGSSSHYKMVASKVKNAINENCWDSSKNMYADTPEKKHFSQHANIFAVLSDVAKKDIQKELIERIYNNTEIAPASYYFTFYLAEAMRKVDSEELYFELLPKWREMLDLGLTTFAEQPDPTRSDCHAWSSSPMYFFLTLVCGIESINPGFEEVKISPTFGNLDWIKSSIPHRFGDINIQLEKSGEKVKGEITLPIGLSGIFHWNGNQHLIKEGANLIDL